MGLWKTHLSMNIWYIAHFPQLQHSVIRNVNVDKKGTFWGGYITQYIVHIHIRWWLQIYFVTFKGTSYIKYNTNSVDGVWTVWTCTTFSAHCSDVIIGVMASQITGVLVVYSTVCSSGDKENIKAPRYWPWWGEFAGDRWIPRTIGQ